MCKDLPEPRKGPTRSAWGGEEGWSGVCFRRGWTPRCSQHRGAWKVLAGVGGDVTSVGDALQAASSCWGLTGKCGELVGQWIWRCFGQTGEVIDECLNARRKE